MMDRSVQKQCLALLETPPVPQKEYVDALRSVEEACRNGLSASRYAYYGEILDGVILSLSRLATDPDGEDGAQILSLCREILAQCAQDLRHEKELKKEIVFLPYKVSMWDSFESVWKAAAEDKEHCNAYVIPIPYADRNPDGSVAEWHCERDYPSYVPILDWQTVDLKAWHPDVIFIHNPYDDQNIVTSVEARFYSGNLKECTDKLVYIPYFVSEEPLCLGDEAEEEGRAGTILTPGVINADLVVVQSEATKELYINILTKRTNQKDRGYWEKRIVGAGSPKIEKVLTSKKEDFDMPEKWKRLVEGRKVILYNTSLGAMLQNSSQVCDKLRDVFSIFRDRTDVALWWRPHPLMKSTFHSMRPQFEKEYLSLEKQYIEEGWGIYDDSPDLHRAICWSDAYYGDESSVVSLYRMTGRPILIQFILPLIWANMTPFHWNSIVYEKESSEIFFKLPPINILFRINVISWEYEKTRLGTVESITAFDKNGWAYSVIQKADDKIFFYPWMSNALKIYHLGKDIVENVPLKRFHEITDTWSPNSLLHGGAQIDRCIYFYSFRNIIVSYNLDSGEIEYITKYFEGIPNNFMFEKLNNQYTRLNGNCVIDKSFFVLMPNTNCILEFDTENQKTIFHYVESEEKHYVSIFSDGLHIWLGGNGSYAMQYSPKTRYTKEYVIENKKEDVPYFVIANENCCMLYPWNTTPRAKDAVFFNIKTGEQISRECKHGYWLASLLENGKILALDTYEESVDMYDSSGNFLGEYHLPLSNEVRNIWKQYLHVKETPSSPALEELDIGLSDFIDCTQACSKNVGGDANAKCGRKIYHTVA